MRIKSETYQYFKRLILLSLFASITIGHDIHDLVAHHHVHEYECTSHDEESHFHEECSDCEVCPFCQLPTRTFEVADYVFEIIIPDTKEVHNKYAQIVELRKSKFKSNSSRAPPALL